MPKLLRWRRWNAATFLATLAAAVALVTGAGVTLANSATGTTDSAQSANSASAKAVSANSATSGIAPAIPCSSVAQLDLAAAVPGVPFEIT